MDLNLTDLCESEAPQQAQTLLDNKIQDLAQKETPSPAHTISLESLHSMLIFICFSPELGYCAEPHLSFVQFPSREEYSLEYCVQVGGRGVEPLKQCGKDCICKQEWEVCADQNRGRGVTR